MNIKRLVWKVLVDVFLGSLWDIARIVLYPFAIVALLVVWPSLRDHIWRFA